jgi:hypothetical protein
MTRRTWWSGGVAMALVLVLALLLATSGCGGTHATRPADPAGASPTARYPAARGPLRVAIYGDSLAWEAGEAFDYTVTAKRRAVVRLRIFGGTAICDWLARMRTDASRWHPQAVVVEFSGDTFTACMHDSRGLPLSSTARDARYAHDAQQVVRIFSPIATRLYFVDYPISAGEDPSPSAEWNRLNGIYAVLAARSPRAEFVDAAQAVEDHGHYTDTLPCLMGEPCTGPIGTDGQRQNLVRAPDGVHFCPNGVYAVNGVTVPCTIWSSGAYRYGIAMAAPIIKDFGV